MAGPWLSNPPRGEGLTGQKTNSWVTFGPLIHQLSGSVRGMIIQHEDFENRVITIRQGPQTRAEAQFLIACGNQNRNFGWWIGHKTYRRKAENPEVQKVINGDQKETEENN